MTSYTRHEKYWSTYAREWTGDQIPLESFGPRPSVSCRRMTKTEPALPYKHSPASWAEHPPGELTPNPREEEALF